MSHIKSADTSTSVAWSQGQLDRILARYGCSRAGRDTDNIARTVTVWFTIPDHKLGGTVGPEVPVRLTVRLGDIEARLNATASARRRGKADAAQVERVAWRHLVYLVEAGLMAAEVGVKTITEFFLADTMVLDGTTGKAARFIDALDNREPKWRALLGSGDSR